MIVCRCKFDSSNMKQMRDFLKDQGNCFLDFLRKHIKLLRISEKFWVTEVTSEVWTRFTCRPQSSSTTLGRQYATAKSRTCWTTSALDRIVRCTQPYREMFEESRAAHSATGPEIDRIRRREEELLREVRSHKNDRAIFWGSIILESDRLGVWQNPGHQKTSSSFASYAAKLCNCENQPPNFARDLKAEIESQKTEIQSLQRDLESTQDSLNKWDEVNLNSLEDVYVDDSVGTSISSVSQPSCGTSNQSPTTSWEETLSCFDKRGTRCRKQHQHWLQLQVRHQRAIRTFQWQYTIFPFRRFLYQFEVQELQWQSMMMEDPKKKEAEAIIFDKWPQPTELICWKMSFKNEVSHSSQYPRTAMLWKGEVEDIECIDELSTSASITGRPIPDFENLDFKIASGLWKILTGNFKKQITTSEGKAPSEKTSRTGRQIVWMICDVFKICGDNEAILDIRDYRKFNWITTTFKPLTQSGTKYDLRSLPDLLTTYKSRKNWNICSMSALKGRLSATRTTTIGDWSWWTKDISSRKSRINISKRESETRTDLQ